MTDPSCYHPQPIGKNPVFVVVAVLSLNLGIGANTAIFALIPALIPGDLPVGQPKRLVNLSRVRPDGKVFFCDPLFREAEGGQRGSFAERWPLFSRNRG